MCVYGCVCGEEGVFVFTMGGWDSPGREGQACGLVSFFHLKKGRQLRTKANPTDTKEDKRDALLELKMCWYVCACLHL